MSARPQSLMRLCRFGVRCLGTALESGSKLPHSKKAPGKGTK